MSLHIVVKVVLKCKRLGTTIPDELNVYDLCNDDGKKKSKFVSNQLGTETENNRKI